MNRHSFIDTFSELKDKESRDTAIFYIKENLPHSMDLFRFELDLTSNSKEKNELIAIYNRLFQEQFPYIFNAILKKEYLSCEDAFTFLTSIVFQKELYKTQTHLKKMIDNYIQMMDREKLGNSDPLVVLKEINETLTRSLIIDNTFIQHYDFTAILDQNITSQYSLSFLILIIAERLELPIFGIPFEDKMVLCYANEYCSHNETVFEDDIQYYAVIGTKDLIYTLSDLKLYAMLMEESLDLKNILPHSSGKLAIAWLEHLNSSEFDPKTKRSLSSIYQHIFANVEEI